MQPFPLSVAPASSSSQFLGSYSLAAMISKLSSPISARDHPSMLHVPPTPSSSFAVDKSNRKFLVFCAFLFTLLLGASLQCSISSCLPTYDRRAYQKAFIGQRLFGAGVISRVRAREEVMQEKRRAESAEVYKEDALQCDRSHYRTDVCVAKGDVRVSGAHPDGFYQVMVLSAQGQNRVEHLKPYTRKWEQSIMKTIDEVTVIERVVINGSSNRRLIRRHDGARNKFPQESREERISTSFRHSVRKLNKVQLSPQEQRRRRFDARLDNDPFGTPSAQGHHIRLQKSSGSSPAEDNLDAISGDKLHHSQGVLGPADEDSLACQVQHEVPAILFSTGGYTGNVYHEFNDGLIPLFITAQQYPAGQVVLIVLEYHDWWMSKYAEILAQISNHAVIDLARDRRVHCFPEVTVGLRIHDELAIHAENRDHASMKGFQSMLRAAYAPAKRNTIASTKGRPKLVLMSRDSPRALLNEKEVVAMAEEVGFGVQVLKPTPRMRMGDIFKAVNRCDVMVGVHGAAMTHLLFMRPGATFIQVVPLGTDWAAATYYGEPAQKLGLNYVAYKVGPAESSLSEQYAKDDPVLVRPETVNEKGWWETKRIYLERQDVTVSLRRLQGTLRSAYARAAALQPRSAS